MTVDGTWRIHRRTDRPTTYSPPSLSPPSHLLTHKYTNSSSSAAAAAAALEALRATAFSQPLRLVIILFSCFCFAVVVMQHNNSVLTHSPPGRWFGPSPPPVLLLTAAVNRIIFKQCTHTSDNLVTPSRTMMTIPKMTNRTMSNGENKRKTKGDRPHSIPFPHCSLQSAVTFSSPV